MARGGGLSVVAVLGMSACLCAAGCGGGKAAIKTTTGASRNTSKSGANIGLAVPLEGGGHRCPSQKKPPGEGRLKMKVTVLAYLDHVTGGEPESGHRLVGVKVRLTNTGNTPYSCFPAKEGWLATNTDSLGKVVLTTGGNCVSPSLQKIAPGENRIVCLPFQIKKAQWGATFDYCLDADRALEYGEWKLR